MIFVIILLILIVGIVSPLLCSWFVSRNLRKDKELDWKRQNQLREGTEQIGKKTEAAAQLVIDRQIALDNRIDEIEKIVTDHNTSINLQLQKINMLVNSDMMAARRDELIRTKEAVSALQRVVTITTMSKQQVATSDMLALESAKNHVEDLEIILGIKGNERT